MNRSNLMIEKAFRLRAQERCHVVHVEPGRFWLGFVHSESGRRYLVTVVKAAAEEDALGRYTGSAPRSSSCTCTAGAKGQACSHVLAADSLLREASESIDDLFDRVARPDELRREQERTGRS